MVKLAKEETKEDGFAPAAGQSKRKFIPVSAPSLGGVDGWREFNAAADCLRKGQLSQGPMVELFEKEFAEANGCKFGVACSSGTAALHLALLAAGIGKDDVVAIPSLTMIAVARAVVSCGAKIFWVDSDPRDGNPAASEVDTISWNEAGVTATVAPHLYGEPCIDYIHAVLSKKPQVKIIQDCAEAHYAKAGGNPVASFGDFACYSTYANKVITTGGEGGIVLTNNEKAAQKMKSLRSHCFGPTRETKYDHDTLGFNYRLTDIQAAIGVEQNRRRKELLARREEIADRYYDRLHKLDWLKFPQRSEGSVWWVYPLVLKPEQARLIGQSGTREWVCDKLHNAGIESRPFFSALGNSWLFDNKEWVVGESTLLPTAHMLSRNGFYLPLHTRLSDEDVDYICDVMEGI